MAIIGLIGDGGAARLCEPGRARGDPLRRPRSVPVQAGMPDRGGNDHPTRWTRRHCATMCWNRASICCASGSKAPKMNASRKSFGMMLGLPHRVSSAPSVFRNAARSHAYVPSSARRVWGPSPLRRFSNAVHSGACERRCHVHSRELRWRCQPTVIHGAGGRQSRLGQHRRDGPEGESGKIVEVEDEAEHKTIEVWVE